MSTNATIFVKTNDNEIKSIYNHYDGYPDHLGLTLVKHFNDQEAVEWLINQGDASFINKPYENENWNEKYDSLAPNKSTFFKDRGETDVEAKKHCKDKIFQISNYDEYIYFWDGSNWFLISKYTDMLVYHFEENETKLLKMKPSEFIEMMNSRKEN